MANEVLTEQLTGAQVFMNCLREQAVDTVFGYPGAIILSIYEEFYKSTDVKHYLTRHEQAAVHAAEGYARVTDKPGVVLVTSGPGATNTITGIANAYHDCYPLVVFCGQVPSNLIGKTAFQEVDIVDMTKTCTKWSYQVKSVEELEAVIKKAFEIANTGKKGPVLIDLPKNILEAKQQTSPLAGEVAFQCEQEYASTRKAGEGLIQQAIKILSTATRPIILAGGGVISANASEELTKFAKKIGSPVTYTMMGAGAYGIDDETNLGMLGVLGNYWANQAICECDVLFAIGTRFTDRINPAIKNASKNGAKIIYIDLDHSEFAKDLDIEMQIEADIKEVLGQFLKESESFEFVSKTEWIDKINNWKSTRKIPQISEKLHAHTVLEKVYELTKEFNPIVATEVGQHQLWTLQAFNFTKPRKLLTSGGLGTMGFGFPAAMGACLAKPDELVLNIAGDGSIQMNIQELATCVHYKLPVKNIILNNGYLGMVRQWQQKLYDGHYCGTDITSPDFVKVAEAYGAKGIRVEKEEQIESAIKEALEFDGPVFLEFIIEPLEVVYPWIS